MKVVQWILRIESILQLYYQMYCIYYCKLQFSSLIILCDFLTGFLSYYDKVFLALAITFDVIGFFTFYDRDIFLYIMWSEFILKNLFRYILYQIYIYPVNEKIVIPFVEEDMRESLIAENV